MLRLIAALVLWTAACGDSDAAAGEPLELEVSGLTGEFELWEVDMGGTPLASFDAAEDDVVMADARPADGTVLLLVEKGGGPVIAAGKLKDGEATLRVSHSRAVGEDFEDASAQYTLATPTNGPDSDEKSGIWYLGIYEGDTEPSQALFVPELSEDWIYEGWVEIDGVQISTGRFRDPAAADDDASHSGPMHGPPYPGEDLLNDPPDGVEFPTDLEGERAFISLEYAEDDAPEASALIIFDGTIEVMADANDMTLLDNVSADLPTVTVRF